MIAQLNRLLKRNKRKTENKREKDLPAKTREVGRDLGAKQSRSSSPVPVSTAPWRPRSLAMPRAALSSRERRRPPSPCSSSSPLIFSSLPSGSLSLSFSTAEPRNPNARSPRHCRRSTPPRARCGGEKLRPDLIYFLIDACVLGGSVAPGIEQTPYLRHRTPSPSSSPSEHPRHRQSYSRVEGEIAHLLVPSPHSPVVYNLAMVVFPGCGTPPPSAIATSSDTSDQ